MYKGNSHLANISFFCNVGVNEDQVIFIYYPPQILYPIDGFKNKTQKAYMNSVFCSFKYSALNKLHTDYRYFLLECCELKQDNDG